MYNKFITWLATCFMALTLSACSQISNRPAGTVKPNETSPVTTQVTAPAVTSIPGREFNTDDELLNYARHFGELSADNQKKEYVLVTQALSRNKKDQTTRLKAALIYSLPGSRLRDNTRALSLLTDLQRDKPNDEDISALISILKDYVEDRQKLEDINTKLSQRVKDAENRTDELQQKLNALKNIDKTMIDRGQGSQK